jgi:hypothetical protein
MLLNLIVSKSECLHSIFESGLSGANLSEEINSLGLFREDLLNVVVSKVNYTVSILPN